MALLVLHGGTVIVVTGRPKHPTKELEQVLRDGEQRGWRITRGKKYYKMYCPCEAKHMKTVKITPSDPNYRKNLLGQLGRETCWEAGA